jgi:hypothetical protein
LIDDTVLQNPTVFLRAAMEEFQAEFGYLMGFSAVGCLVALRHRLLRLFLGMALGFSFFYLLVLRGALIHQYYLLPLTIPVAILSCGGFFWLLEQTRSILLRAGLALFLVLSVGESTLRLDEAFAPVYSEGVVEVAERLAREEDHGRTLVLGGTCRIFQYYLSVPTAQIKCDAEGFLTGSDVVDYLARNTVQYVIAEENGHQRHELLADHGFHFLFMSDYGRGALRYVVYRKNGGGGNERQLSAITLH